jgi:hypothetical protein
MQGKGEQMKKVIATVAAILTVGLTAGAAFAGEVTGNGKPTPVRSHIAASICSFSGLEDWTASTPQPEGPPEGIAVRPGVVQVPRHEGGNTYPPGVPGFACSPGRPVSGA